MRTLLPGLLWRGPPAGSATFASAMRHLAFCFGLWRVVVGLCFLQYSPGDALSSRLSVSPFVSIMFSWLPVPPRVTPCTFSRGVAPLPQRAYQPPGVCSLLVCASSGWARPLVHSAVFCWGPLLACSYTPLSSFVLPRLQFGHFAHSTRMHVNGLAFAALLFLVCSSRSPSDNAVVGR